MKKWNKLLLSAIVLNAMVAPSVMATGTGTTNPQTIELTDKAVVLYNEIFPTSDDKLKATQFRNLFAQYIYDTVGTHPFSGTVTTVTQPGDATELAKWFTVNGENKRVVLDQKITPAALELNPSGVSPYYVQELIYWLTMRLAPNESTTTEDIEIVRHQFGPLFDKLFGAEVTVEKLIGFSTAVQTELYKPTTWVGLTTNGSNLETLINAALKKAITNVLATSTYAGLDGKLETGLGLSIDDLLAIRQNITDGFVAKRPMNEQSHTFVKEKLVAYGLKKLITPPVVTPPTPPTTPPTTPPGQDKPRNPNYPTGTKVISNPAVTVTIVKDANGVETTVVKVKKDDIQKALKDNKEAQAFVIPVEAKGGKAKAKLDLSSVTEAANTNSGNTFLVSVGGASYYLPSDLIDTKNLTGLGADLTNAEVEINVIEKPASVVKKGNSKMVAKVVDFSIVVKNGESSLELNNFGSTYVDRGFEVADTLDSKKAVGVVVNEDGSVAPVPTEFSTVNGKKVAVLKRNSNSTYTVVENNVVLKDIDKSWAKADIQLLADKLLVTGYEDGTFKPQGTVTRAEFVCLLARGLGFDTTDTNIDQFSDVSSDDWHAGVLKAAVDAGLINGFEDGTFRPDAKITRQDASVVLANAIEFLSLRGDLSDEDVAMAVKSYSDQPKVSGYAKSAVGLATSLNILSGNGDGTFNPTANATRAESVIMLEKLLVQAKFLSN